MYSNGFLKVALASNNLKVGDPFYNANEILKVLDEVKEKNASIVCFPEMSLLGYTVNDLVFQSYLYNDSIDALEYLLENNTYDGVLIIGSILVMNDVIYNCSFVIQKDEVLGIVPKNSLPDTLENNQGRLFGSGALVSQDIQFVDLFDYDIPFGNIIFENEETGVNFGVEVGSDLESWTSPSEVLYSNGALVVFNPTAISKIVGKDEYYKNIVKSQSYKFNGAYLLTSCNASESTSDAVYGGLKLAAINGEIEAEENEVKFDSSVIYVDIDLEKIHYARKTNSHFKADQDLNRDIDILNVYFELEEYEDFEFEKDIDILPFVPKTKEGFKEIIDVQAAAVIKRLKHIGINKTVIGVSGGLDSTLTLLSLVYGYEKYGLDKKNILGFTLPSKATSDKTLNNSILLMEKLGVTAREIPIYEAVKNQLDVIGHDEANTDVTYENVQARYRTFTLMNLANELGGVVIGTSDMSEVALGWATFNGDHMAMYGMNAGLPKTVVRKTVEYYKEIYPEVSDILDSIIDTPISPELSSSSQATEEIIGKYEINDFILYRFLCCGDDADRIVYLLNKFMGLSIDDASKYVINFNKRFYSQQFKRLTSPEAPKILKASLSPRGELKLSGDISRNL